MKLFIGCSSSNDILEKYINDCKNLLEILLKDNTLVFGASNLGLMGLSYNTAVNLGSDVIAVAPEAYKDGFKSLNCTKEILTKTVNNRTDRLILESDLILFLPGGIGTVYEFFSSIESRRCGEFDKPIIIYNSNGYYDKLLEFMNKIYDEKFSDLKDKDNYFVSNSIKEILDYISNYYVVK